LTPAGRRGRARSKQVKRGAVTVGGGGKDKHLDRKDEVMCHIGHIGARRGIGIHHKTDNEVVGICDLENQSTSSKGN
jgi:hypothetical protein